MSIKKRKKTKSKKVTIDQSSEEQQEKEYSVELETQKHMKFKEYNQDWMSREANGKTSENGGD